MAEATASPARKARRAFVAVLLAGTVIGLGATAANALLRGIVEKVERSEVMLERLEGQAFRLSALQWQVIAEEGLTPSTFENVRAVRTELAGTLRELEQQEPDPQTFAAVRRAYDIYVRAVDEEFALVRYGNFEQATLLHEARVDPALGALREAIGPAREGQRATTQRLEHVSLVSFAVILFVANVATVLLFRSFQKARHAAEQAIADAAFLAQREESARLLGEMGDRLRASTTPAQAHAVIASWVERLFPEDAGALYVYDDSRDALDAVAVWGGYPRELMEEAFGPDQCEAFRTQRAYWEPDTAVGSACKHVHAPEPIGYVCIPMFSDGVPLGLLHFRHAEPLQSSEHIESAVTTRRRLAVAAATGAGLALANLRLQAALREQATRDPLSGLCNRRFMEATFDRELARAERHDTPVSVVMVDVDNFKSINDTYGHAAGDSAIVELSDLLRSNFRGEDIICRYGGDEFVVVLPGIELADALRRAELLQDEVRRVSAERRDRGVPEVAVSLGISEYPQHGQTSDALIDAADAAMYRAKAAGRDRLFVAEAGQSSPPAASEPRESSSGTNS